MYRSLLALALWGVLGTQVAFAQTGYRYYDDEAPRNPSANAHNNPPTDNRERTWRGEACEQCGTVTQVETLNNAATPTTSVTGTESPSVGGLLAGGVVGALLGNQVGKGSGRKAATLLGAAGGAYVGNMIAKGQLGGSTSTPPLQRVHVRFDDGSRQTFDNPGVADLQVGERVQAQAGGRLLRLPSNRL